MLIETNANLKRYNTFQVSTEAPTLVRIQTTADIQQLLNMPELAQQNKFILGGGSNVLFTQPISYLVLKSEIMGKRLIEERDDAWIIEVGAGETWHDVVRWSLSNGWPGLENLALIPGTAGAAPVQNIGAYGVEVADRFESLDAVDLTNGQSFTFNKAQCQFGYRSSIFKTDWAGKAMVTHVRLNLPKRWEPILNYRDLEVALQKRQEAALTNSTTPLPSLNARDIFEMVCDIRIHKLPDPAIIGNGGSFFKNPIVSAEQCTKIIAQHPEVVFYELADGQFKLAAGWLIDACGWKGKTMGDAGVYEKQALVLVNKDNATGAEILSLSQAIQASVYEHFGVMLEPELVIV